MRRRFAQRGEGNIGCILWLVVLLVAGLVLWKAIPVKMANATLYDHMIEMTKFSARRSPEYLKKQILNKAEELKLPVKSKNVQVEKKNERIRMRVRYMVPVELLGFTYEWKVDHEVDRPIFYL